MRTTVVLLCLGLAALAVLLSACWEDKGPGAPDLFPPNATKLYFGDCNPFTPDQESTDLVFDASDACTGNIEFPRFGGVSARWNSNAFRVQPGTYYEGCHLRVVRDMADAGGVEVLYVAFDGLAVSFLRRVEIPVRETSLIVDLFEEGTVTLPADTMAAISVQITDSIGGVALDPSYGVGSYVMTGADQATVCRFEIDLGLAQGLGHPNQGVNFAYLNAVSEIRDTLAWDFTGGARVLPGPVLLFGPRYGVAYLTAESGGCHDTASFWAPPGTLLRDEMLERLTTLDFSPWGFVSDGNTVWWWDRVANGNDTLAPWMVRVLYLTQWPLIEHPVYHTTADISVLYDETRDLIWIVYPVTSGGDSAWGYTTSGVLDTAVALGNVPIETMYLGGWLYTTVVDVFFRRAELVPLTGGTPIPLGPYPIELTRQFAGGAGVGYPGVAGYGPYSINVFDSLGNWIARQPVTVNPDEYVLTVGILAAGHRVIYQVTSSQAYYFRALQPQ
jgi:hypothetical protein